MEPAASARLGRLGWAQPVSSIADRNSPRTNPLPTLAPRSRNISPSPAHLRMSDALVKKGQRRLALYLRAVRCGSDFYFLAFFFASGGV